MESWRRVEIAASEELGDLLGAGRARRRRSSRRFARPRSRSRRSTSASASPTMTSPRSSTCWAQSAGEAGRWIHFGLTSSDVLDTALALQLRAAGDVVLAGAYSLVAALHARAREHASTLCVGRTHGVHAEPTTFGLKLAGFAFEAHRNATRLERAFAQAAVGTVSGAVGTYAATSPDFEARVLARLGLEREDISTQVVARDRHAELVGAIALAGAGLERLRHRDPPPPADGGARGAGALPRRAEGVERDAAQAQPDQERADLGPRARAARERSGGARERRAVARARHLALLGRARDPARLDDPAGLPPARGDDARRGHDRR